jgi:hypothetical protein
LKSLLNFIIIRLKRFDNPMGGSGVDLNWPSQLPEKDMSEKGLARSIKVLYYSGYKDGETPRALLAGGREFPVERVLSRQRALDGKTGRLFEIFRIQVAGRILIVRRADSGRSEILLSGDLSFLDPPA